MHVGGVTKLGYPAEPEFRLFLQFGSEKLGKKIKRIHKNGRYENDPGMFGILKVPVGSHFVTFKIARVFEIDRK